MGLVVFCAVALVVRGLTLTFIVAGSLATALLGAFSGPVRKFD